MDIIVAGVYTVFAGKVKFTLEQAMRAQRGSRGISLYFLYPRRYMGVGSQHHAPGG
jgi:hypothetical protein